MPLPTILIFFQTQLSRLQLSLGVAQPMATGPRKPSLGDQEGQ